MIGFNGGLIGLNRSPFVAESVPGVWTPNEQIKARRDGTWRVLSDEFYSSVSLLLHGNGTNNGTSFIDNSPSPLVMTRVGNTVTSTAQSKFGGSSLLFDGNGDALTAPNTGSVFSFSTNSYTMEAWIRPAGLSGLKVILSVSAASASFFGQIELAQNGTTLNWSCRPNTGSQFALESSFGGTLITTDFQHVALSVNAGAAKCFLNGTQVGENKTFVTPAFTPVGIGVGMAANLFSNADSFNGYLDEVRVTKGASRYNANFTPSPLPFPDIYA
jgi:hypothetical protein